MDCKELTFGTAHTYTLEEVMNQTDYSTVYRAFDETADRAVCIKEIDLGIFKGQEKNPLKTIAAEVSVMAQLGDKTTHVPYLIDSFADLENNKFYIVMQLCDGVTLANKMIPQTKITSFLRYMIELCGALEILHGKGMYHKDVKPQNIMVTSGDEVILLDFNLTLFAPNLVQGTPGYRAPEMETKDYTADRGHADIFSVGLILYEFFAQRLPVKNVHYFVKGNEWGKFKKPSESPKHLRIPEGLEEIIMKCLSYNPKNRYSATELKQHLICVWEEEILWKKKNSSENTSKS